MLYLTKVNNFSIRAEMDWFILSLISAIMLSLREFTTKRAGQNISALVINLGFSVFSFVIFFTVCIFTHTYYSVTPEFAVILLLAAIMDAAANIMYISSIKNGDLSKTVPMLCFIPVIQLFVTPVLIHENMSCIGIIGVFVVVSGSYLLHIKSKSGFFSPFKAVFRDRNAMMMLAAACIWGVSSSFHKMGIHKTDVLFWVVCEYGLISIFLLPFAYRTGKTEINLINIKKIFIPALFSSCAALSYFAGISLGPVAYVSSVRRLGVLFSMIVGLMFFREKLKVTGFIGGFIMIAGAVIISLFG
jgi:uncharacterized membrane protein